AVPGYLVAGLGFGLAANMRPAYVPVALVVVGLAAALPLTARSWRRRGVSAALVLGSALLASAPQMLINHHQRGSWSPLIAKGHEISLVQLWDGMHAQKYETYVGPRAGYPEPGVYYLDPATTHVVAQEHISPARRSGP